MNCNLKKRISRTRALATRRSAFTLIELLVVIALTSILMLIVFKPLISSIELTSRATTQTESQAAARDAMSQVSQILSSAQYVMDPTGNPVNIWTTDSTGATVVVPTLFTQMEYVPPAHSLDQNPYLSNGSVALPIDPTTGMPYTDSAAPEQKGVALPLANGILLGKLFLATANNVSGPGILSQNGTPLKPYFNYYEYANTAANLRPTGKIRDSHNPITLYKAEVTTYIPDPANTQHFIPNLKLFHTGTDITAPDDTKTAPIILHDPNFFYDNSLAGGKEAGAGSTLWAVPGWKDLNGDGKVQIWENWRAVSTSLVRTDKVDLLSLLRDSLTNAVVYDPVTKLPTISPLATFKPAFVQNDPGVATNLDNSGNESPYPISPTFVSQYDHWSSNYRVFLYRDNGSGTDPTQRNPLDLYEGYYSAANAAFRIVHITGIAPGAALPNPDALPDVSPQLANGVFNNPSTQLGFTVSSNKGLVSFAYPSTTVVHGPSPAFAPAPQRYSPNDINTAYSAFGPLGPGARRFLMLTAMPLSSTGYPTLNLAGIISPLNPASGLATVSIVPGTEQIFGPDQRRGTHYGHRVQYTRVSAASGFTGPNQYKINYVNNANIPGGVTGSTPPSLLAGYVEFDNQPDGSQYNAGNLTINNGTDPTTAQPAVGDHMLPIFKTNPATGIVDGSATADPVEVYYNFQMNQSGDVVKFDYMTRDLMNFTLEMRLYDIGSGKPQVTRLTDKVKVRNLQH